MNGLAVAKLENTLDPANGDGEVVNFEPVENGDAPEEDEKAEKEGTLGFEAVGAAPVAVVDEVGGGGMVEAEGRVGEVEVDGGAEPKGEEVPEEGCGRDTKGEELAAKEEKPFAMGFEGAEGSVDVDATG